MIIFCFRMIQQQRKKSHKNNFFLSSLSQGMERIWQDGVRRYWEVERGNTSTLLFFLFLFLVMFLFMFCFCFCCMCVVCVVCVCVYVYVYVYVYVHVYVYVCILCVVVVFTKHLYVQTLNEHQQLRFFLNFVVKLMKLMMVLDLSN